MPGPRTNANDDAAKLKHVINTFLEIADNDIADSPVGKAFASEGILGFVNDFLNLTEDDINSLLVPPDDPGGHYLPLSVLVRRKLITVIALYHDASRAAGGAININTVEKEDFDHFRTSVYDHTDPIKPWNYNPIENRNTLSHWLKNTKPTKSDFKEFKDDAYWNRWQERFITSLEAAQLLHLIDPGHKIGDAALDTAQMKWLFKILQDCMTASTAKTIVTNHISKKDTRKLWIDLCEHFNNSMTTHIRAQTISTYLTSTRLDTANWRGNQTNFLLHWKEQSRTYNEMSTEKYTDNQLSGFLEICVAGTPNLSQVRTIHATAARAAGVTKPWSFQEYISELLNQSSILDASNVSNTNPRARRQTNKHEMYDFCDDDDVPVYDANVHDMDTPITEINAHDQGNNPRHAGRIHVRMNKATWDAMSPEDQATWDKMSDGGKVLILTYASNRGAGKSRK